jgi:CheY-like chemotaxis protein
VETASGAKPALELIATGRRYDAILCDVMMPQMSGTQFHEELLRVASDQVDRLAFLTGGVPTSSLDALLAQSRRPVVAKPCDPRELLEVIQSLHAHPSTTAAMTTCVESAASNGRRSKSP